VTPAAARALVQAVAATRFGASFAMLAHDDPALDRPGGAALRQANLAHYLVERTRMRPVLLVGEAMGYAGGRFSGIAFTAERTLLAWGAPYAATSLRPEGYAEQSGTIVHGLLASLACEHRVLLWNVVPAHPHPPGQALRNRTPAAAEIGAGAEVLREILRLVDPVAVVPVGRSAERALGLIGGDHDEPVRHPANGGATAFRAQAAAALARHLGQGAAGRMPQRREKPSSKSVRASPEIGT